MRFPLYDFHSEFPEENVQVVAFYRQSADMKTRKNERSLRLP